MPSLRVALFALAVAAAGLAPRRAAAFTDKVHQDVAEQAARLMPGSLRGILAKNADRLREGAELPLRTAEDGLFLYPDGSYGTLDATVRLQTQRVLDMLAQRAPMGNVVREMGVLSHLVALASDPLHVTAHDTRTGDWSGAYESFIESRQPRFRVAFFGYGSRELDKDDVGAFVRASAEHARTNAPVLREMFLTKDGKVASTASFDDKHPVFGIASINYSRAITDTARLWLYVWIKSGGDSGGLPFPQALSIADAPASAP